MRYRILRLLVWCAVCGGTAAITTWIARGCDRAQRIEGYRDHLLRRAARHFS